MSHNSIFTHGMHFLITKPSVLLREHISVTGYKHIKITASRKTILLSIHNNVVLSISGLRCEIDVNAYETPNTMELTNKFLLMLGIKYELYKEGKQPRIRGEEQYIY